MRKWKVKLPGGHVFELESDDPGRALLERGHTSFALEEITPPPIVPVEAVAQEGKLTLSVQEAAEELGVCSKTVYNLIHRADFPVLRIAGRHPNQQTRSQKKDCRDDDPQHLKRNAGFAV